MKTLGWSDVCTRGLSTSMTELVLQQLMYSVEFCTIASVHSGILCILENACVSDGYLVQNVIYYVERYGTLYVCGTADTKTQPVAVEYAHSQQYWIGLYVCVLKAAAHIFNVILIRISTSLLKLLYHDFL